MITVNINTDNVQVHTFLNRMDLAYAAADIIISRAGASSVSELCVVGKPVIFIPSPNVSEDHQTKNALAVSEKNAALLLRNKIWNQVLRRSSLHSLHLNSTIRIINKHQKVSFKTSNPNHCR